MKIGIMVCSQTGNTLSVVEAIKEKLNSRGLEAVIEKVEPQGEAGPGSRNIQLKSAPDVTDYDKLIFAGPVNAFSLAPAMKLYMSNLPTLEGKDVALLVTKGLKFNWTGGNKAIAQMKKYCTDRRADIAGTGIIVWSSKTLKEDIEFIASEISEIF
ncbi:MAG: flavodoxin family protein [Spirochaetales bacterium]|nr:flavodoxin family protein [Spirochaetales bacterium]